MMLSVKGWRESRIRFLSCLVVRVGLCAAVLWRAQSSFPPPKFPDLPFTAFVWGNVIGNLQPLVFATMALILGLGGLQRERAANTAAFTLALPILRNQLMAVRFAMGVVQLTVLALVPAIIIPTLAPMVAGHGYPMSQAVRFGLLYLAWGTVFPAVGLLWSTLWKGAYTPLVASVLTPFVYLVAIGDRFDTGKMADANFALFMSGIQYFAPGRGRESILGDVFPWMSVVVLCGIATAIAAAATVQTDRLDF